MPITELSSTIKNLSEGAHAIVFDGIIDRDLVRSVEKTSINCLVGMNSKVRPQETKIKVLTVNDL